MPLLLYRARLERVDVDTTCSPSAPAPTCRTPRWSSGRQRPATKLTPTFSTRSCNGTVRHGCLLASLDDLIFEVRTDGMCTAFSRLLISTFDLFKAFVVFVKKGEQLGAHFMGM